MKTFFKNSLLAIAVGSVVAIAAKVNAQVEEPVQIYPLTNSTTFTVTGGAVSINASSSSNIFSQPFPVWRGRGFTLDAGVYTTGGGGQNVQLQLQFASVVKTPTGTVTNWSNTGGYTANFANTGTTETFAQIYVPPSAVDNVQYGRLAVATNANTAALFLDPTNTFVQVFP